MADTDPTANAHDEEDTVALTYWRHHCKYWEAFASVDNAIAQAFWMREDEQGAPDAITSLEGRTLLSQAQLDNAMDEYEKSRPVVVYPGPPPPLPQEDAPAALELARFLGVGRISSCEWSDLPERIRNIWRAKAGVQA